MARMRRYRLRQGWRPMVVARSSLIIHRAEHRGRCHLSGHGLDVLATFDTAVGRPSSRRASMPVDPIAAPTFCDAALAVGVGFRWLSTSISRSAGEDSQSRMGVSRRQAVAPAIPGSTGVRRCPPSSWNRRRRSVASDRSRTVSANRSLRVAVATFDRCEFGRYVLVADCRGNRVGRYGGHDRMTSRATPN